ncbi:MAG: Ca2+-dependent phosphoinositide-specific phospholipase C [Pseudomonadota bacterium]
MRRHLLAAFVLIPAAGFFVINAGLFSSPQPAIAQVTAPVQPAARPCDARCEAGWLDANLRVDQLQVVGTGKSYKQRPSKALLRLIRMGGKRGAEALDFGHPTLAAQLDDDVRALSFDVAHDPKGGHYRYPAAASMAMELLPDDYVAAMRKPGFKVLHVLDVDYNSSCLALTECLKQVAAWSRAHPRHLPITITLRTNDVRTPMPGATTPQPFDGAALDALENDVRAVFAADQLITPDQVQGDHPTLREAALAHAWPKLGEARGKVMLVLDDTPEKIRAYQGARKSLEGRAMFVAADEASPAAAFLCLPDPVKDAPRITRAVNAGFMVITRADADTREARQNRAQRRDAAFASGAQIVQTDFAVADRAIGPYRVSLADHRGAVCGTALAPERCVRFEDQPLRTAIASVP